MCTGGPWECDAIYMFKYTRAAYKVSRVWVWTCEQKVLLDKWLTILAENKILGSLNVISKKTNKKYYCDILLLMQMIKLVN